MKKSTRIRFTTMILIVILVVITMFSSCSADSSSPVLCNVKLDSNNVSRSFEVIRTSNLSNDNLYYRAIYCGNDPSHYGSTQNYVKYDKSKGIILSQGLWEILCIWKDENDATIASGSTGSVWINLNTTSFIIYLDSEADIGKVSIHYVVIPSTDYLNPYVAATITGIDNPSFVINDKRLIGNISFNVDDMELPSGKYILTVQVKETNSAESSILFTDVYGFLVKGSTSLNIDGVVSDLPKKLGTTEESYMEEFLNNKENTIIEGNGQKVIVDNDSTTAAPSLNTGTILNNTIYEISPDSGKTSMKLGHSSNDHQSDRLVLHPDCSSFGINLKGTNVTLSTSNDYLESITESTAIVVLDSGSEMTLYNRTDSDSGTNATWAFVQTKRRFESNTIMNGGKLNIVGIGSPSKLSNGSVIFRGPMADDSDDRSTLLGLTTRKQGTINFNSNGGTVVLDGNVEMHGSVGFSSWTTGKTIEAENYTGTINSDTNIDIAIKNGASVIAVGDTKTDQRWKDTAYGMYLRCNGNGGTINVLLDNGTISTSGSSPSSDESGVRIDSFKGTLNITIRNGGKIESDEGSAIYLNNCPNATVNLRIEGSDIESSLVGSYKIKIVDGGTVNVTIINGETITTQTINTSI